MTFVSNQINSGDDRSSRYFSWKYFVFITNDRLDELMNHFIRSRFSKVDVTYLNHHHHQVSHRWRIEEGYKLYTVTLKPKGKTKATIKNVAIKRKNYCSWLLLLRALHKQWKVHNVWKNFFLLKFRKNVKRRHSSYLLRLVYYTHFLSHATSKKTAWVILL